MTRSTNNSMRKIAVTGLALIGMILGSLGTVGCDEGSAEQVAQAFLSGGGNPVQLMAIALADDKSSSASAIIRGSPPRR